MPWEDSLRILLDRAIRRLRLDKLSLPYEREAIAELLQAGQRVALVNPRQVRQFANGLGHLAKTDPIDARVLAKFGQTVEPPCLIIPTGPQAELKQLVERRRQLVEFQTAETNRQKQLSSKKALISVAEVQGNASGFGFGLAIVCDFVLVAENASLAFPEMRSGLAPAAIMALSLIHI